MSKQGKVLSKLSVNLLLEIYANNATLIGVEWLPGSQTCIAVGTRDFIKVYNLAEDYIAPTHNILIMNGFISTFSFGKQSMLDINGNRGQTTVYVASKEGKVYY